MKPHSNPPVGPLGHTRPDIRELVAEAMQHDPEVITALAAVMQRRRLLGESPNPYRRESMRR